MPADRLRPTGGDSRVECAVGWVAANLVPMGKASRRKKVHPAKRKTVRPAIPFVARPFEGLERERELVAMREIIPCAIMTAKTAADFGGEEFDFVTLLPDGAGAMVRGDGRILVGLQTRFHTGDLSHDLGAALKAALDLKEKGEEGIAQFDVRDPAPRLQEMLDDQATGEISVLEDFSYWFDPNEELDEDMREALVQNREDMVPTEEIPGAEGMYWCEMNNNFVRYVVAEDEDALYTALARLQAAGQAQMGEGSQFVGAFRACGIGIPVFQVDDSVPAADFADAAADLQRNLTAALAEDSPLTDEERRARAGMVSRQVTIR